MSKNVIPSGRFWPGFFIPLAEPLPGLSEDQRRDQQKKFLDKLTKLNKELAALELKRAKMQKDVRDRTPGARVLMQSRFRGRPSETAPLDKLSYNTPVNSGISHARAAVALARATTRINVIREEISTLKGSIDAE